MSTVRRRSPVDRLERAAAGCSDLDALSDAVFTAIAPVVPYAFACLATLDPASGLISRAFKSHPLEVGTEEFAAVEYGRPDINLFSELARRPVPVGALSIDTDGSPERCLRFREFMAPVFGFTDELRAVCSAQGTAWAALALYRGAAEPAFDERDVDAVAGTCELIADGVRRTLFADNAPSTAADGGPAVLILDADDRLTDVTVAAQARIDDLGGWENNSLPDSLLGVAARARADGRPVQTRVPGRSGRWLLLQALLLAGGGATNRSVVVTVDTAAPSSVGQLALAARGLTAREQDVAQLVLQGASTKAIAQSLFLSPHTVQDHLKAVFRKLGVTSRREMIAQLVLPEVGQV